MTPRRARSGGILARVLGGLLVLAAAGALAWMLLLPAAVESRFAAATGSELSLRGLMGDPFAGRATVGEWTLRASSSPEAPVLARGGASRVVTTDWRAALGETSPQADTFVIDRLDLDVAEARLTPAPDGTWPLLGIAAAAGLPFEKNGAAGDGPRLSVRHLKLTVDTLVVRDARTDAETSVRIAWRGEFENVDHSRPVFDALLEAVRAATAPSAADPAP